MASRWSRNLQVAELWRRLLPCRGLLPCRKLKLAATWRGISRLGLAWWIAWVTCLAQDATFHLRNGDRLTGRIVAETSTEITIATSFGPALVLPKNQIIRQEKTSVNAPESKTPTPTPVPVPKAQASQPQPKAAPQTPKPGPSTTSAAKKDKPPDSPPSGAKSTESPQGLPPGMKQFLAKWDGELELGSNLGFGTKDRQTYSGRLRAVHVHSTPTNKTLRNTLDYLVSYGKADGALVDNRMDGSWKIDFDLAKRFFLYNASGAGYDEIRKIDLRFDVGPGVGYVWLNRTNFVLKTELGGNYQEQHFANTQLKRRYSTRIAEEAWWQVTGRLRLDEKLEFFPDVKEFSDYRIRFESNLSYLLQRNLTLKLTVIDLYDTHAPPNVSRNDLQIRSSIGFKF